MQKVCVITDSSACLSVEFAARQSIQVVPIEMLFQGKIYRDGVDDPGKFYRLLRDAPSLPKTSAPSPSAFLEAFRTARRYGRSVLCITLPSNLSSVNNSCQQAIKMAHQEMPDLDVRCMESGAVAAGQGLIVLQAARAAAAGAELAQVMELVDRLPTEVHFFAMLDTLEFLARGGHVPKAAAWLGHLVGVRPILTAPRGDVKRITQARSRRSAIQKILSLVERNNPERRPIQALVMHAEALDEANNLADNLRRRFPCEELEITQFSPVMGTHSGPGVVGVAYRVVRSGEISGTAPPGDPLGPLC